MWWNAWEGAASMALLATPAVLVLAIVVLGVTRADPQRVRNAIALSVLGFFALLLAPYALHILVPPPFEPAFAGGAGLDLRGVGILWASWLAGVTYIVVGAVGFAVITHLAERRKTRKAPPERG